MCGGKPKRPPSNRKKASKNASASTPAAAVQSATDGKDIDSSGAAVNSTQRRKQRMGKRGLRVGLDVAVANVGGTGKSGLNIPSSD